MHYLFVPFWTRPNVANDTPAGALSEFRWFESVALTVDVGDGGLDARDASLVRIRERSDAEANALCDAIRARPSGAALFARVETP